LTENKNRPITAKYPASRASVLYLQEVSPNNHRGEKQQFGGSLQVKSWLAFIYQTFQSCISNYWKINRVRRKWRKWRKWVLRSGWIQHKVIHLLEPIYPIMHLVLLSFPVFYAWNIQRFPLWSFLKASRLIYLFVHAWILQRQTFSQLLSS